MPTVKGIGGPYRFFFFSFDCNEPQHIHVQRERQLAKFWLEPISLSRNPASADRDRLPARLRPFFWDYRLSELSWSRDRDLIASRILQAGDWPAITWLRRRLGDKNLRAWLISGGARALDRRRRNFWDLVLDVRTRPRSHAGSVSTPPEGDPAWERRTR
jgi:hypothetical protein